MLIGFDTIQINQVLIFRFDYVPKYFLEQNSFLGKNLLGPKILFQTKYLTYQPDIILP